MMPDWTNATCPLCKRLVRCGRVTISDEIARADCRPDPEQTLVATADLEALAQGTYNSLWSYYGEESRGTIVLSVAGSGGLEDVRLLAHLGYVEIVSEDAHRLIARWKERKSGGD